MVEYLLVAEHCNANHGSSSCDGRVPGILIILLMTALARGYGVAGPEEWLIPKWKRRKPAYGAPLQVVGKMEARA